MTDEQINDVFNDDDNDIDESRRLAAIQIASGLPFADIETLLEAANVVVNWLKEG